MLSGQFLRHLRWVGVLLALLTSALRVRADGPAPVGLVVFGDELPREELRSALERELGRPVTLLAAPQTGVPYVTVTWRRNRSELAVTYDEPGRGTVARVIGARATGAQTVEDATVLATTLVKNEADELLRKTEPPALAGAPAPVQAATPVERPASSPGPLPPKPAEDVLHRDDVPATASLFFPAATNWNHPHATTRFSLNLLYGLVGELDNGVQLGTVNVIVGKSGVATGNMLGAQFGFGLNYASGRANGLQIALGGNGAGEGLYGGQLSLGANISGDRLDGFQVGAFNLARDVRGTQLGLVNVGKKVTGLTIGLINVADEIDGVPIGVVSVTRSGGIHPVAWGSSASSGSGGVKFSADHTYTILAAQFTVVGPVNSSSSLDGAPIHYGGREFVGGAFYLGGHIPIRRAFVDVDAGISALAATEATWGPGPYGPIRKVQGMLEPRVRVIGGYSFARHLSLFAGASLAVRMQFLGPWINESARAVPELLVGAQF